MLFVSHPDDVDFDEMSAPQSYAPFCLLSKPRWRQAPSNNNCHRHSGFSASLSPQVLRDNKTLRNSFRFEYRRPLTLEQWRSAVAARGAPSGGEHTEMSGQGTAVAVAAAAGTGAEGAGAGAAARSSPALVLVDDTAEVGRHRLTPG
jgi:hypothetical protein